MSNSSIKREGSLEGSKNIGSIKSKTKSGNTPSNSANNGNGYSELNQKLRSVFVHRLGLPLLYAFHDEDKELMQKFSVKYKKFCIDLGVEVQELEDKQEKEIYHNILKTTVNEWLQLKNKTETQLTKALSLKINEIGNISFKSHHQRGLTVPDCENPGYTDIVLSKGSEDLSEERTTPLAVIEVGLHSKEWWTKVDQNMKYVQGMCSADNKNNLLAFEQPFLFVVMTISTIYTNFESKIGVFLCSPRPKYRSNDKTFRLSLLWHSKATDLDVASKDFGKLLRVTSDFATWRESSEPETKTWLYFGSNCCQFNEKVSELCYLGGISIVKKIRFRFLLLAAAWYKNV